MEKEILEKIEDPELRTAVAADATVIPPVYVIEKGDGSLNEQQLQDIKKMSIPQRTKLALFGNRSVRGQLIRDSNRIIPLFVLDNPRISEDEVAEFAKNSQLDDAVIRKIANSGKWLKNYSIKYAVVINPKTPLDISIKLLKYLQKKDIQRIAKSKNLPQVVSSQAIKLLEKQR